MDNELEERSLTRSPRATKSKSIPISRWTNEKAQRKGVAAINEAA